MKLSHSPVSKQQFKRMFKNQSRIILLLMFFGFAIEFMFTIILSTSTIRQFAETYFKLIPPMVKQMLGFMGESFMGSQFIAFGFTHPAILFMLCFVPISIASRYITAEIEGRSIELLAIRLMPRSRIIFSSYFFSVSILFAIYLAMISGSLVGAEIMGLKDDIPLVLLLKIAGVGLLFFAAIGSISTFISSLLSERGTALSWNIGVILLLFVFDALIRLWPKVAFLKPFSLFNWYQPVNIANGKYDFFIGLPLLALILILFLSASVYYFNRRDL
jgi:ABC-type transport system involved in multi-copper enzyme maturation permease subunit